MDPAHLLPSVTKMVLGAGEEWQSLAESSGDADMGCTQSLPQRQEAQGSEIALPCCVGTPNTGPGALQPGMGQTCNMAMKVVRVVLKSTEHFI